MLVENDKHQIIHTPIRYLDNTLVDVWDLRLVIKDEKSIIFLAMILYDVRRD